MITLCNHGLVFGKWKRAADDGITVIIERTSIHAGDDPREAMATYSGGTTLCKLLAGTPSLPSNYTWALFWYGPNYAVEGLSISRSTLDELPELCLRLKESDYFSFLATQQLDREFPDGTTPRGRYLQHEDPEDVPTFMSCSFGTNVALVTADNQLVVARRSHRVGSRPNLWSSSANEGLSRQLDSDGRTAPDIYRVMRRGVEEELSIGREEYRLELLAISVERQVHQWGAFFSGSLHGLTGNDVLGRRGRGVPDKWESSEIRLIPFNIASVFTFIAQETKSGEITPHLPVLLYLALVRRFGSRAVEREGLRVLKRHGLA